MRPDIQTALDRENGLLKKKRIQEIRTGIREEYGYSQHDVEAIFRSALMDMCSAIDHLYLLVSQIHPSSIDNKLLCASIEELRKFNNSVNEIKKKIDVL